MGPHFRDIILDGAFAARYLASARNSHIINLESSRWKYVWEAVGQNLCAGGFYNDLAQEKGLALELMSRRLSASFG